MARKSLDPHKVAVVVADAFGVAHFLIANIILILGEHTTLFSFMNKANSGFHFVVETMDGPAYALVRNIFDINDSFVRYFLFAEMVFIASSLIYGVICYFAVRGYISFFVVR